MPIKLLFFIAQHENLLNYPHAFPTTTLHLASHATCWACVAKPSNLFVWKDASLLIKVHFSAGIPWLNLERGAPETRSTNKEWRKETSPPPPPPTFGGGGGVGFGLPLPSKGEEPSASLTGLTWTLLTLFRVPSSWKWTTGHRTSFPRMQRSREKKEVRKVWCSCQVDVKVSA